VYLRDVGFQKPKHGAKYRQERYYVLYYYCVVTELIKRLSMETINLFTLTSVNLSERYLNESTIVGHATVLLQFAMHPIP
jgi:hypothetical protein